MIWSEQEEAALAVATGRVHSTGSNPSPDALFAEFIRCNGGTTTRTRGAVLAKVRALWASYEFVRASEEQRGRSWYELTRREQKLYSGRMPHPAGISKLTKRTHTILKTGMPHKNATNAQKCKAVPTTQEDCAGKPSNVKRAGYNGSGYEDVLEGALFKQWQQFGAIGQALVAENASEMERVDASVLEYAHEAPPRSRKNVASLQEHLTRPGEYLLELVALQAKQKEHWEELRQLARRGH